MKPKLDLLIVVANGAADAYQKLSEVFSAIEPPTWGLLLAQSCRAKGYGVAILDAWAEQLSDSEACLRIKDLNPRLVLFCVYGQNPNSGTTNMSGAVRLSSLLRESYPKFKIAFVGSHVSALPKETLSQHSHIDLAIIGEGVYALHDILNSDLENDSLLKVSGLALRAESGTVCVTSPSKIVPQERMDIDLPGYAWDLLPYKDRPLDLYRSHFWHADFHHNKRTPFAAIYTSLGCRFSCDFCMINIINRTDYADGIVSADSKGMRYWSTGFVLNEMEKLATLGVETLRIADEMFFLDKRFYDPLLKGIIDRNLKFRMWAYSRVDTVKESALELFKKAGINWLALGIEAGNQHVRQEVAKGSFKDTNIREVVKKIQHAEIKVIANYIFGFPEDNLNSMQETQSLALELNTEMANMYTCLALPGSPMYQIAKRNNWKLPKDYSGFAFLGYDCLPLPTKHLNAEDVLRFRDAAWLSYFTNPEYLALIEKKFGITERVNIQKMTEVPLRRKILGH